MNFEMSNIVLYFLLRDDKKVAVFINIDYAPSRDTRDLYRGAL